MGHNNKEEMGFKRNQIGFLEIKTVVTNCHTQRSWKKNLPLRRWENKQISVRVRDKGKEFGGSCNEPRRRVEGPT